MIEEEIDETEQRSECGPGIDEGEIFARVNVGIVALIVVGLDLSWRFEAWREHSCYWVLRVDFGSDVLIVMVFLISTEM